MGIIHFTMKAEKKTNAKMFCTCKWVAGWFYLKCRWKYDYHFWSHSPISVCWRLMGVTLLPTFCIASAHSIIILIIKYYFISLFHLCQNKWRSFALPSNKYLFLVKFISHSMFGFESVAHSCNNLYCLCK